MSDENSNKKFAEWISNLEIHFLFSSMFFVFGMVLIILGILQWLPVPKLGNLVTQDQFRWATIVIGTVCIFSSPFFYRFLKLSSLEGTAEKPFRKFFAIKYSNPNLGFGIDHIDKEVFRYYLDKSSLTTVDKRNAMSAVLRMISLTTLPSSISTLVRMSIYEVRDKGRFNILAAHHIDANRLSSLESLFSHRLDKPSCVVGYAVTLRESIKINDVEHPPAKYKEVYVPTVDNENIPAYKSGSIMAIPILEDPSHPSDSSVLAVLSISASKTRYFTPNHEEDLNKYCDRVRNLLIHFNAKIRIDPIAIKNARIITISGQSGAGKTTLMNELFRYLGPLGWRKVQIGKLFRDFCSARGYEIEQIEQIPAEVHRQFDDLQEEILKTDSNIILEGRMSGYLASKTGLRDVLRIFCDLPLDERIRRFADREAEQLKAAEIKVMERDSKDLAVYSALYGVENYRDTKYYNLYLDTTKTPDELSKIVFAELNKFGEQ